MRTFQQKQNQPQQPVGPGLARPQQTTPRASHHHTAAPDAAQNGATSYRPGHDFGRIPLHPPATFEIQTKLAINEPGDEYEQEADRIADEVTSTPRPQLQRSCACERECPDCLTEPPRQAPRRLQTKRDGAGRAEQTAPPIVHDVLQSLGQPLDAEARNFMESRFGHDFSSVRVHSDGQAAESARVLQALGYTVGRHIIFGAGQYSPGTPAGRRLLAHELSHVMQQEAPPPLPGVAEQHPAKAQGRAAAAVQCQRPAGRRPSNNRWIVVDSDNQNLYAYESNTPVYNFNCVTGDSDNRTSCGRFNVFRKEQTYRSRQYNAQMNFAMFFHRGQAIHESSAVGVSSFVRSWVPFSDRLLGSHGCVRLASSDAQTLFNWTPMGTPVEVTGGQCAP